MVATRLGQKKYGMNYAVMWDALRGLAQESARREIETAGVIDFTDSSGGTAAAAIVALTIPSAAFDGQSSGASPGAAFNTAAGVVNNALGVMADTFNNVFVRLGLPQITFTGTVATDNTIPSMTTGLATTNGATAVDYTAGVAAMTVLRNNYATINRAANMIAVALGESTEADLSGGSPDGGTTAMALEAIVDTTSGTGTPAGATSISDTVMDAFLLALANNVATLSVFMNDLLGAFDLGDLTDNSGGTGTDAVAAITIPVPYTTAGTDCSPKAGFDAELAKMANNIADLSLQTNLLTGRWGLADLTDNSGGTANTTLEIIDVTLTANDGVGDIAVEEVTGIQQITDIVNNMSTLISKINELAVFHGLIEIVDSSGGTVESGGILVECDTATGTGVDGTALSTLADTAVDAAFAIIVDSMASAAAKLNEMSAAGPTTRALKVVAVA